MTRILIVEDDEKIAALLSRYLGGEGYDVEVVVDGESAVTRILASNPELTLLDLMLPGKDGIEVCRDVRPAYAGLIIMMTASDDEFNELIALNTGVDDYVNKPVRLPILLARIQALLRRGSLNIKKNTIELQDLVLDRDTRKVTQEGAVLDLTDADFELLWVLAEKKGEIVTRDELFERLLGKAYDGLDRAIDMRISKLRKQLGDEDNPPRYIRTLRGRGYIMLYQAEGL